MEAESGVRQRLRISTMEDGFKGLLRLMGCAKNYDWGRSAKESWAASLYKLNSGGKIDENLPYAEFWMGTHESGPSCVVRGVIHENGFANGGGREKLTLKQWIENNPTVLGPAVLHKWGTDLPFLFKVLSVAKALSIQAHPDKELATRLHKEQPLVYKDDNHKPEMALALTEFEALCGFTSLEELKVIVQTVPEIIEVVGKASVKQVLELNKTDGEEKSKLVLKKLFTEMMSASKDVITKVIAKLISRLNSEDPEMLTDKEKLVLRLEKQYPADVGLLAAFLFNHVKLNPGEALYLGADEPHAYVYGECVECMATSDNVVRAGLTPKHRDVAALCSMLTYKQGYPEILHGKKINAYTMRYLPPFDEFEVDRCILPAEQSSVEYPSSPGPSIFIVMRGEGTMTTSAEETVAEGDVLFAPANSNITIATTASGLHLYRAGVSSRFFTKG